MNGINDRLLDFVIKTQGSIIQNNKKDALMYLEVIRDILEDK